MTSTALVTGAGRGIGLEIAKQLAQKGMNVVLSARSLEKARAAAAELNFENIAPIALDITNSESLAGAAEEISERFGQLDLLINNAAVFADWMEVASTADLTAVQHILDVNLIGTWRTVQTFLPLLHNGRNPRIVNVSSGSGLFADPNFGLFSNNGSAASYGISKAAINALTAKLSAELGKEIVVVAAGPGLTATAPGMAEMGARPVQEGAASIVWAATESGVESGKFYRDGQLLAY
ncbi:MAG: SDR family NAD(P)-dependent oxidoreductase [Chloroflexota bacterium]